MNNAAKLPVLMGWEEKFNQNDELIDEQHRGIVSTINAIHFLYLKGDDTHIIKHVMILHSQLQLHFKTEMLILKEHESPHLKAYEKQANRFLDTLLDSLDAPNDEHQTQFLFEQFKHWWQQHLQLHEEITPYLSGWEGDFCRVVS